MARTGTCRRSTATSHCGASPRAASANSTREVTYSPELRHDSTATSTMAFMIAAPPGTFIAASTMAKGELPGTMLFHGTMLTMTAIDKM